MHPCFALLRWQYRRLFESSPSDELSVALTKLQWMYILVTHAIFNMPVILLWSTLSKLFSSSKNTRRCHCWNLDYFVLAPGQWRAPLQCSNVYENWTKCLLCVLHFPCRFFDYSQEQLQIMSHKKNTLMDPCEWHRLHQSIVKSTRMFNVKRRVVKKCTRTRHWLLWIFRFKYQCKGFIFYKHCHSKT